MLKILLWNIITCDDKFYQEESADRKQEQQKYGIFYDDDYDYMQHLKDVDELNEVEADVYRIPIKDGEQVKVVFSHFIWIYMFILLDFVIKSFLLNVSNYIITLRLRVCVLQRLSAIKVHWACLFL